MNAKALQFIKNIGYAVGANISRILTTLVLTLLLPKLMSVEDYSYWQLYGFYGIYLAHSSIGWCEGTYLKYGGCDYDSLDRSCVASQFWGLALYEGLFVLLSCLLFFPLMSDMGKLQALGLSLAFTWIQILRYQLQTILQATSRISDYAKVYTGERLIHFVLVMICMICGYRRFQIIAGMEVVSNLLMLVYAAYLCRRVTFCKLVSFREAFSETRELIRIGYKLTLAGLASQMIIGIVRFAIEHRWGTIVFGKISLSFSMANMMITCITAVSIVLFPMLRKSSRETLLHLYQPVRTCMTVPMFGVLIGYVPAKTVLAMWLPQYADSLRYLAILFPFCIYETRNTVLVWTYLKTIRREQDIMKANVVMVAVSAIVTGMTVYGIGSLELAVISIIVLYAAKAVYTELLLAGKLEQKNGKDHVVEGILTAAFIACSWLLPDVSAWLGYLGIYAAYVILERGKIRQSIQTVRELIKP